MSAATGAPEAAEDDLDAIYERVLTCQPVVDPAKEQALADAIFSKELMIRSWRAAAMLAAKGGDFYRDLSTDAGLAQSLAAILDPLEGTAKFLREMASIMDCVVTRVCVVGCKHERFDEWRNADSEVAS